MTSSDIEKDVKTEKGDIKVRLNVQEELTDEQKAIIRSYLRKIDLRTLPIVMLLYIFALIDRGNIGAALVSGLAKGLNMSKSQQGDSVTYFYVFYLLCETPSNVLLKKTKPHIWFALIASLWSISCIGLAFAKNGTTFVVLRAALGAFEAGLTPGVVGYLTYWYTRSEVGFRMSIFFLSVPISGIINGPLSAALASKNLGPFKPYQAIFFVEGVITLVIAISSFFILVDYPDQAKFLTPEEKDLLIRRLNAEQGMASTTKPTFRETLRVVSDWKIYIISLIFFGVTNFAVIVGTFAPTMLNQNGFSSTTSIYLSALPALVGLFGIFISMRLVNRIPYSTLIVFYSLFSFGCYAAAAFLKGKILQLTFLSLSGLGSSTNIPLAMAWSSVNQGGVYKSLISSALIISIGSVCGVVIPRFFVPAYGPKFLVGHSVTLGFCAATLVLTICLRVYYTLENKRRDDNPVDFDHIPIDQQRLFYDRHPNFRYQY